LLDRLLDIGVDASDLVSAHLTTGDSSPLPPSAPADHVPSIPRSPLLGAHMALAKHLAELLEPSASPSLQPQIQGVRAALSKATALVQLASSTGPDLLSLPWRLVAFQICLLDAHLFYRISPHTLLPHTGGLTDSAIRASTDFFNYLSRSVEYSILIMDDQAGRVRVLGRWSKIAKALRQLRDFQGLAAILAGLSTTPVRRLTRTWGSLSRRATSRVETLRELMDPQDNYARYRMDAKGDRAIDTTYTDVLWTVPFLGVYLLDVTYLRAADPRIQELLARLVAFRHSSSKYPEFPPPWYFSLRRKGGGGGNGPGSDGWTGGSGRSAQEEQLLIQQRVITHFLLTRPWVDQTVVDEMSRVREEGKSGS
ncbi:MAG: ras guanine nucleotide exchange factor domain-containing protein, partial [Piptocephalis tieghemiana]